MRRSLTLAASAAALVVLASGCTADRPGPVPAGPDRAATHRPAPQSPGTPGRQNSTRDADLALADLGPCRYDPSTFSVTRTATVTGRVSHPVVATVWLTAARGSRTVATGTGAVTYPDAGPVESRVRISAPVSRKDWVRTGHDCTLALTWSTVTPSG